ncbi:hypothetical protein ACQW5G_02485 [Fructilactobacillus sp. Tb1]|uniref:hypothetical protein n=1 Tax=Fructilactobacillus sp. Tb1 TaxID=3422304 RepID=UPI003D2B25F3
MNPFFNGNNDDKDKDEDQQNQIFPFLPPNYAVVVNAQGNVKINKVGFSYTSLFFGILPAIMRADWYNLACMVGVESFFAMLLTYITGMDLSASFKSLGLFFEILWGAIYNLMYFRHLQNKGYIPENENSKNLLFKNHYFKKITK